MLDMSTCYYLNFNEAQIAIKKVVYRTSAYKIRRILDEFIKDFHLLENISSNKIPRYRVKTSKNLQKQLIRLEENIFPF